MCELDEGNDDGLWVVRGIILVVGLSVVFWVVVVGLVVFV